MYHSIQFIRPEDIHSNKELNEINPYIKNTYDEWSLVPTSRPSIAPPKPKIKYVDIPGSNGQLDFSTALTGYPVYENREGSWTFMIDPDHTDKSWSDIYSEVMDWLQGKEMCCILEDDQSWYYKGRFYVSTLDSEQSYTTINIEYNVYPYKKYAVLGASSESNWLWDPFDFVDGIIPGTLTRGIEVNSNEYQKYNVLTTNPEEWYSNFSNEPIIPTILISGVPEGSSVQIRFKNEALYPDKELYETPELGNGTYKIRNIIFGGRCLEHYIPKYYPNTDILMGDANDDGMITGADASLVLGHYADPEDPAYYISPRGMIAADMNFDGKVTSTDANYILKLVADLENLPENYTYSINNTLSIEFKGHGTISFLFVPGRL